MKQHAHGVRRLAALILAGGLALGALAVAAPAPALADEPETAAQPGGGL